MPLTRRQIIQLTEAITERHDQLARELAEDADRNDAVEAADTERDLEELRELAAATDRLADGSYGACVDCGADIEVERLFARPGVARCIACQRRHEKTHAGPARSSL
jgi:RNA polymerase-binding transcription factor DksA